MHGAEWGWLGVLYKTCLLVHSLLANASSAGSVEWISYMDCEAILDRTTVTTGPLATRVNQNAPTSGPPYIHVHVHHPIDPPVLHAERCDAVSWNGREILQYIQRGPEDHIDARIEQPWFLEPTLLWTLESGCRIFLFAPTGVDLPGELPRGP